MGPMALLWRSLFQARAAIADLRRIALRAFVALTAVQAAIVGVLVAMDEIRKRRQGPREGFPWADQPEVEIESGDLGLKLYPFGVELYDAMLEAIEAAERHIYVGTFIWKGDEVGRRFVEALAKRAREGVRVCVIFDGLANVFVPPSFKRFPQEIHTLHFRPLWGPAKLANPRNIFRYHRHLMAVDGSVAFLGGYNIGSLYAAGWRDTQVRVRGVGAHEVENDFVDFWNAHRSPDLPELEHSGPRDWDPSTIFHRNDPYMRIFPIRAMYLEAIDRANRHIYLTHAYFIPDRAMRKGLVDAVKRGVDVQVLVPEHSNHVTADWLARRHFYELLEAGVRVFLYRHIMIHSKTATVDGVWSTVGSANIDRYSLLGNYEINLEVYSRRFADQMEKMFELDKTNARELTLEEWKNRPLPAKAVERVLQSLSPLV
jgi:cardiolipin synthase A/B